MKINRDELLAALKIIKPAIATRDIVEEFTAVWFTGTHLVAGNDVGFGIRVPFVSEFKGGIRGTLLLGLATATRVKEFDLEPGTEESLILKAGRARAVLAVFPIKKMLTAVPEENKINLVAAVPTEFLVGLDKVLISSGSETRAMPEQKGVTIVLKDKLHLFATDGATIAEATCKPMNEFSKKAVLFPTAFALALIANNVKTLSVGKGNAWAKNDDKVLIFTNLLQNDEPKDLIKITEDSAQGGVFVPIPARLKLALARAAVLLDKQKQEHIRLKVEGAVLRITTSSALGDLKDTVALDKEVPTADVMINPSYIQRALATTSRMYIGKKAMVLAGDNFNYFMAYKG